MIRTILIPVDCAELSEQALPAAMAIARKTGARIRLACVHVPVTPEEALLEHSSDAARFGRERETVERLAAEMTAGGVPTESAVLDGPPAQALADDAASAGADLVVMTTHGRGPVTRALLGSVSDYLIRLLKVPTLLVRPACADDTAGRPGDARHLLVALDGSPAAEAMLPRAVELGEAVGARFTLLRVVNPLPGVYTLTADPARFPDPGQEETEQTRRLAVTYLEQLAAPLRARGLAVATRVVVHPVPSEAILTEARDLGCDLIALESLGHTGLARLLLGSVADAVIRGAATPVLTHLTPSA
jgi:nucleotide-binding universal stress UspA family protein